MTDRYQPGPVLVVLGRRAEQQLGYTQALPALEALADATGEAVNLGIRSGAEVLVVLAVPSAQPLRFDQLAGSRVSIHTSAMGKCLLAYPAVGEDALRSLPRLSRLTPRTITRREQLTTEVERTRDRGWALNDEERNPGWEPSLRPCLTPTASRLPRCWCRGRPCAYRTAGWLRSPAKWRRLRPSRPGSRREADPVARIAPRAQPVDLPAAWAAGGLVIDIRPVAQRRTDGDRLHPLWVLLSTTGMRRGEALGLRWSDVDLDAGRLRVVQTVVQVCSKVTIGEPKTARGRRPIALDAGTVAVLREHRRRSVQQRMLVGPAFEDRGIVFHDPDGSCLKPDAVSAAFVRRVCAAGLPRLTLKGLRHTWATVALERGIHPRVVQERLGHSTIAITLGIYSHVAPTLHDEAAQLVADLVLDA